LGWENIESRERLSGYRLIIFRIVISCLLLVTHSSWENYSDEKNDLVGGGKEGKEQGESARWKA
jgi:hypothetical protein